VATAATAATAATTETAAPAPAPDAQVTTGAVALTGLPAEATADTTVPAGLDLSKATAAASAAATPAQDGAVAADSQQQAGGDASGQEQPNTPAQPAATTAPATAATASTTTPKVDAPVEAAPVAAPVATAPVTAQAAPAQVTTPSVERAVPLSRAVATTGVLIHMAAERGVTHARLNLKPVELGGIEVRLQTSPQGVRAQLVADSPEAARMLSSASEDLRRSLEERDVTLLSLDVSTSGDRNREAPAEFTDAFGESYRPGGSNSRGGSSDESGLMDSPALAETTLVLPDGVHVDVLA
jgi:flagellar hook-length control protein FliK